MNEIWSLDVPATPILIKETLWKKLQRAMFGKKSTTQLSTQDINKIYDVLNKAVGEKTGIYIPFPNKDDETEKDNN